MQKRKIVGARVLTECLLPARSAMCLFSGTPFSHMKSLSVASYKEYAAQTSYQLGVAGQIGDVLVQRHTLLCGAGLGHRQRHRQDRVRAQLAL